MTPPDQPDSLFIGLMSGTSADGIDAALVQFPQQGGCRLIHGCTLPWDEALRTTLLELGQGTATICIDNIAQLDAQIGRIFADSARQLLTKSDTAPQQVKAIGSHGQTIRHRPDGRWPFTWQIGDPNYIAEHTGITTIADFRRRDMAAGGQGAPLMPAFHYAMLGSATEDRAVLNLGGIANLSLLDHQGGVRGFDTGPANALLDAWCLQHQGVHFDQEGRFAASGQVHTALLTALLDEPWFALPLPKSTGREVFHLDWVRSRFDIDQLTAADVQATLLELSAITITQALHRHLPKVRQLWVCGGGVHNPVLMQRLAALLPNVAVCSSAAAGLDPDYMEAMGFAWLAKQTLSGQPGNQPEVTGAKGYRILGAIYPGANGFGF